MEVSLQIPSAQELHKKSTCLGFVVSKIPLRATKKVRMTLRQETLPPGDLPWGHHWTSVPLLVPTVAEAGEKSGPSATT